MILGLRLDIIFSSIAFICYFIAVIAWLLKTKDKRSDTAIVCSRLSIYFFALSVILKIMDIFDPTIKIPINENLIIEFSLRLIGIALSVGILITQKKKPKNEIAEKAPALELEEEQKNSGFTAEEIESWVENKLAEISGTKVEDIATGYPVTDYCTDSLDQLGFKTDVNEHFGIDFDYNWEKHGEIYSVMDVINDIKELLEIPEELSENQNS